MNKPEIERSVYHFSIRRPVTVTMIVLTGVVFGLLSYRLLPINIMPEITYPSLTIRAEYPGSAPEEVESVVTRPLEQALGVVRHLVEMTSSSRAEYSEILLEFDWGADMNQATQDVREKLDLVFLPEDVKQPLILRYDPSLDPLMRVGLTSDSLSLLNLRQLTDEYVQQELEKLPGVAAVKVKGGREEEIRVALDPTLLDLMNLSVEGIAQRLTADNINVAGGRISEGESEFILRALNEFQTIDEISNTVIAYRNGKDVRLRDVATVTSTAKDQTSITRVGDRESVALEVFKESDANPINVSELVKRRFFGGAKPKGFNKSKPGKEQHGREGGGLRPLKELLGRHIEIHILSDQAQFIRLAVDEVKSSAFIGGILAVIVLLLFLGRVTDTLTVTLMIPGSLVSAFAAMHLSHISVNIMSLGGLALGVGMMVDNAIVVIESIHRRREAGEPLVEAAVNGTRIVGGAVLASTLTTVVVFFPIVFVTGIAGQVFGDLALTVIMSLSVSLVLALFFLPMLLTRIGHRSNRSESGVWHNPGSFKPLFQDFVRSMSQVRQSTNKLIRVVALPFATLYLGIKVLFDLLFHVTHWSVFLLLTVVRIIYQMIVAPVVRRVGAAGGAGVSGFQRALRSFTQVYVNLLRRLQRAPWALPIIVTLVMVASIFWFLPRIGRELIPSLSQGVFEVYLNYPVGTALEQTASEVRPLEQLIKDLPEVLEVSTRVGGESSGSDQSLQGSNQAVVTVKLESGGDIKAREAAVVERIRAWAQTVPTLDLRITHPTLFTFRSPVEIVIKGDNLDWVRSTTREAQNRLSALPMLTDIESSVQSGFPEAVIRFNRDRLAMLGLSARQAAERVKTAILGSVPTKFREEERRIDIRMQWAEGERRSLDDLRRLIVNPDQPVPVTLAEVAEVNIREGPSEIRHFRGVRSGVITANIIGSDLQSASARIQQTLDGMNLREGADYILTGQRREMQDSLKSLGLAMLLAVFLVYVVMASQFESLKSPFLILLTIPFAVAGVLPALWLFGIPLSVMVFLGLIVLVGIVVNNSIVLVDYTNQLVAGGMAAPAAILAAGEARLRPILMTSLTTILALLPMALGVGEGVEIRRPMAVTVIFGLTYATVISLLVIPLLYQIVNRRRAASKPVEA